MRPKKRVKELDEIILPFTVTFPVTIEGSVNNDFFNFPAHIEVKLTYPQYENINHSSYAKYLKT